MREKQAGKSAAVVRLEARHAILVEAIFDIRREAQRLEAYENAMGRTDRATAVKWFEARAQAALDLDQER